MKKANGSKKLYFIFLTFVVLLLAVGIAVDFLYPMYKQVIGGALGTAARASEEYVTEALENSKNVNIQLQEEGSVLLKNDGVLPITSAGAPVNVYGIISAHHYFGGSGSGATNASGVSLKTALESVGCEVNGDLWNLLASKKVTTSSSDIDEGSTITETINEISLTEYNNAVSWADAKAYSEYAIVTFGRGGAEGSDLGRNMLALGSGELALLQKLHEEGFKVITLIDSSNVIELGPVIKYSDAILWVGGTGLYGTYGIANIITGKTNPSGRLVDTWMYEQETSSSYYTTICTEANYVAEGDQKAASLAAYTNYNEGIYVGYKWYETADAEGYWNEVSNEYGTGYEGVVAYPFGYGLSYTSFTEEITSATYENGQFTFTIKAENDGTFAGKDVLELYAEKPYENGGVEVSKVELVAFGKTDMIAAGGEETLTLTVSEEDLASYDSSANGGKGCYILAGGEYTFYLASANTGAHCWRAFAGDATRSKVFEVEGVEYSDGNKRSSDAVTAINMLEVTDNDTGISAADGTAGFSELSRKDGFANAPQTISQTANANGKVALATDSALYKAIKANYGRNTYVNYNKEHLADVSEFTDPSVNQKKQYDLADLYTTDKDGNPLYIIDEETGKRTILGAVDYNDPRWDVLISQMSLEELSELIGRGGYGNIAVSSIGKIQGYDYDGPTGYTNFLKASLNISQETTGFCSEPIMAATWNAELVEEYGKAVGKEGNAFSNTGWYAPGMNIHRTAFGGRLGEYFSEDSYLTGTMGASVAYGAFEMGIYTYAKHFAFNEIESQRNAGMNCWISEQAAREIYLRPFEIAIKQGKLTGLMSSFMYMNAQWNGGNYNLMSGIVRKEWSFKGVINTDLAGSSMMGAGRALCAGTDMLLSTNYGTNATLAWLRCDDIMTTDAGVCAMKTAAKHILFAYASAQVNREVDAQEADISFVTALYVTINVIGYGGAAVLLGLFVWRLIVGLKKSSFKPADGDPDEPTGEHDAPDDLNKK